MFPVQLKEKTDNESDYNRNHGNSCFNNGMKFLSLPYYNMAIVQAKSNVKRALAYANRSAVFLDLKLYRECLLNIQWARENGYPNDKIQKLVEREEKCKKLMEKEVKDPADDPSEFFKLSYPPNPKIPFVVNCVEQHKINNEARLYASRDLKPGDVIFEETMLLTRNFSSAMHIHCVHCSKSNMCNLIPCLKTASLMFCSTRCRDSFHKVYGTNYEGMLVHNTDGQKILNSDRLIRQIEHAFGGHEDLLEFLMDNNLQSSKKTIFDFDFREDAEKKKIMCCLSLDTSADKICNFKMTPPSQKLTRNHREFEGLCEKLRKIFSIYGSLVFEKSNSKLDEEFFGVSMFFASVRCSCMPNMMVEIVDNKTVGYITRPVQAGEEIFVSKNFLAFDDDASLKRKLLMKCHSECYGCKHDISNRDYKERNLFQITQIALMNSSGLVLVKDIKKQIKQNWAIIQKYVDDPLSRDAAAIETANVGLMKKLACDVTNVFDDELIQEAMKQNKKLF